VPAPASPQAFDRTGRRSQERDRIPDPPGCDRPVEPGRQGVGGIGNARLLFSRYDEIRESLWNSIRGRYTDKTERIGEMMPQFETWICLQVIDARWKEHLYALDRLKEGIGLRGYGQRNPLVEYKRESFEMYQEVHERVRSEVVRYAFQLEPMSEEERQAQLARQRAEAERTQRIAAAAGGATATTPDTVVRSPEKVGRNDPCPCGSGRKYKKCCGR